MLCYFLSFLLKFFIKVALCIIFVLVAKYIIQSSTCISAEIKVLFSAPRGCSPPKTVRPEFSLCTLPICSNQKNCSENIHSPGAHLR